MRWVSSVCLVILLTGFAVGCTSVSPQSNNSTPPPSTPASRPAAASPGMQARNAPAASAAPQPQAPRITADGKLSFAEHKKLTFRTSGSVAQVKVAELDRVSKGQLLARLDTTALEQAVRAAELGLKTAELALKTAETDKKQLEDAVKTASIDFDLATDGFRKIIYPFSYRTFALDIPNALSRMSSALAQLDEAQKNVQTAMTHEQFNAAAKQLRDARENLVAARESLARGTGEDPFLAGSADFSTREGASGLLGAKDFWTVRAAQLAMDKSQMGVQNAKTAVVKSEIALERAKNEVDKARNELQRAKDELDKASIVAPFAGVVARVGVKEGDFLHSGAYATTVAVELIEPARMELVVKVSELDVANIKVGQKVSIRVDALPNDRVDSTVASVGSLPINESGIISYDVKIAFDAPRDSRLKAGMAATASITGDLPVQSPATKLQPAPPQT